MYRSQFLPQPDAIGSVRFFPYVGTTIITPDGQEWLKTGLAKAKTNYPIAAIAPTCQLVGDPASSYTGGEILSSATNGTGTIVIVPTSGSGTNVWVSTNYGATWATVAHNLAAVATSVAYNGTTWVVVANSASNLIASTSTSPASTWTLAGNVLAIQAGGATANTASICWDAANSKFIAVTSGGSATAAAGYSTNGTAWSTANLSSPLSGQTYIATTSGTTLACCAAAPVTNKSTTATSWSLGTATSSNNSNIVSASGKFFRGTPSGITYTSDGTTWTTTALSEAGIVTPSSAQKLTSDGTTVFFVPTSSKSIGSTIDGSTVTYKGAIFNQNYGTSIACGGTNKIFCYGASTTNMYTQNMNTCDYVGSAYTCYHNSEAYGNTQLVGYIRIK